MFAIVDMQAVFHTHCLLSLWFILVPISYASPNHLLVISRRKPLYGRGLLFYILRKYYPIKSCTVSCVITACVCYWLWDRYGVRLHPSSGITFISGFAKNGQNFQSCVWDIRSHTHTNIESMVICKSFFWLERNVWRELDILWLQIFMCVMYRV
jgi:hypothetical protein